MSKYLPFHKESRDYAKELVKGCKTPLGKYRKIISYVTRSFLYDYVRAIKIPKKGGLPDIEGCWQKHMGICLDIASMTTGMLQAVGIDATLCFGDADGQNHAWVESKIGGKKYRYDHDGKAKKYVVKHTFRR